MRFIFWCKTPNINQRAALITKLWGVIIFSFWRFPSPWPGDRGGLSFLRWSLILWLALWWCGANGFLRSKTNSSIGHDRPSTVCLRDSTLEKWELRSQDLIYYRPWRTNQQWRWFSNKATNRIEGGVANQVGTSNVAEPSWHVCACG